MRAWISGLALSVMSSMTVAADNSGSFDYYVLSLSWSPNWCERQGAAQGSVQCAAKPGFGWILHGLWPQFERGWPSYCETNFVAPTLRHTSSMVDIMGSTRLAQHEWEKHGTCSGMDVDGYFETSREAFLAVTKPEALREISQTIKLSAIDIEAMFLHENPHLSANQLTVTCKSGQIQEVRICVTKDLVPRECGRDTSKDCTLTNAEIHPIP